MQIVMVKDNIASHVCFHIITFNEAFIFSSFSLLTPCSGELFFLISANESPFFFPTDFCHNPFITKASISIATTAAGTGKLDIWQKFII